LSPQLEFSEQNRTNAVFDCGAAVSSQTFRLQTGIFRFLMKAKITITPKKAVLDPQGKTVQSALEHMGFSGIGAVHVGKYMEIEVSGERDAVHKQIDDACRKLLSNPVIEDYHFTLE